jgi:hypothetical protein
VPFDLQDASIYCARKRAAVGEREDAVVSWTMETIH